MSRLSLTFAFEINNLQVGNNALLLRLLLLTLIAFGVGPEDRHLAQAALKLLLELGLQTTQHCLKMHILATILQP